MLISRSVYLLILPILSSSIAHADGDEVLRRKGFAEQQKQSIQFDKARESGEQAYYDDQQIFEMERKRALNDYRKLPKHKAPEEDDVAAKLHEKEVKLYEKEYEKARIAHAKEAQRQRLILEKSSKGLVSEEEEYDLHVERPRVDYKKRAMFGAKPNYKASGSSTRPSSGGSGFGGGFGGSSAGDDFPPPPVFDNFSNDSFPPPPDGDDFGGDMPEPVPVPSFEEDGSFSESDFPPPPPPPPPMEGDGDFYY